MKALDLSHTPQNNFILSWLVSFFVLLVISIAKYACSGSFAPQEALFKLCPILQQYKYELASHLH